MSPVIQMMKSNQEDSEQRLVQFVHSGNINKDLLGILYCTYLFGPHTTQSVAIFISILQMRQVKLRDTK